MKSQTGTLAVALFLVAGAGAIAVLTGALKPQEPAPAPSETEVGARLARLRVPFIPNQGQTDSQVSYYAQTFAGTLFVTHDGELVYALPQRPAERPPAEQATPRAVIRERLVDARIKAVTAARPSSTRVSYFLGNDPASHRSGLGTYDELSLGEAYPGIEVRLSAHGNSVEKRFHVQPGADPEGIAVQVAGAEALAIDGGGALRLLTALGEVGFSKPVAYQEIAGRRVEVAAAYRLPAGATGETYAFALGPYDPERELIIDPLLQATYLGGGSLDRAYGLAINPATGDVYVSGETASSDFPGIAGGADTTISPSEVFVSRLSSDLKTLLQSTYLGGSGGEVGRHLAIDPTTWDVYVTGDTGSSDFPGIAGGADSAFGGYNEGFVAQLSWTLSTLRQSTYLGGSTRDYPWDIAVDPAGGDIYVTGYTDSTDFPGISGGADTTLSVREAFAARLSGDLKTLFQSTYLGGSGDDRGSGIAIHPTTGSIYVTGSAWSSDFPGIAGGADTTYGNTEAFVSELTGDLKGLLQSTYLGGDTGGDSSFGIAIHPATGDIYVAGYTSSSDFPAIAGGADTTVSSLEAFASQLTSDLRTLVQSTYLGGSAANQALAIAIHPATGDVYVTGWTTSSDFPAIAGGADTTLSGEEPFVSALTGDLKGFIQSTYLGGSPDFDEKGQDIAIHPATGDVYVAGYTTASDFPAIAGGADTTLSETEGFVARLDSLAAAVADALAADFGAQGLWHYDGSWKRLTTWDPGTAGLAGWSEGLAADFDANGLWSRDASGWKKLSGWNAGDDIQGWSGGLAADFDANGLWSHDGTSWRRLTTWNAEALASWSGGLAADFGTNGTWTYDGATWRRLTSWNPGGGGLAGWSGGLAVDFDANGTWTYNGTSWRKLTSWDPGAGGLAGWSGGLAVDFDANGTWSYDGTSWRRLTIWSPGEALAGWASDLAADFDTNGLWSHDGTGWRKLTGWDAQALEAVNLN